jgi:hypothetical protein
MAWMYASLLHFGQNFAAMEPMRVKERASRENQRNLFIMQLGLVALRDTCFATGLLVEPMLTPN